MKILMVSALLSLNVYAQDKECFETVVRPVFKNKCSMCHAHMVGLDWEDYDTAVKYKDKIRYRAVEQKTMPPYGAPPLTEQELQIIKDWTSK